MRRVLRNYLISFVLIGLIALAVHLVNRFAEQRMAEQGAPGGMQAPATEVEDGPAKVEKPAAQRP